tara:strand:+ start:16 stop:180 length:165 start_codon:yes stop_codon:yes gene_type:complete
LKEEFEKYCQDLHIITDFKDGSLLINDGWGGTAFLNKSDVEKLIENRKKRIENE